MKMMLGALAVAGVGAGVYSTGAFEQAEYYEMAPQDVAAKLRAMQMPAEFAELQAGNGDVRFRLLGVTSEMARWDITHRGEHLADLTANLSPSGSGTKVTVEFDYADSPLANDMRKVAPIDNEFIGKMVEIGMAEQIDATLDGRAFDERKMAMEMVGYIAKNPKTTAAYADQMQELAQRDIDSAHLDIGYSDYEDSGISDWAE